MPNPTAMSIPADAFDKSEAKVKAGTDYYAELTDEERVEEGLPPREEPKPEAKVEPEPEKKPEPVKAEPVADDEEPEDDDIEAVFAEVAALREDLAAALGKPEPAKETPEEDPLIKAGLEHDDEVVQGLTKRLQQAEARLEATEKDAQAQRDSAQRAQDDKDFAAVQETYTIGGKPMTDAHVEKVERYILQNPEVGTRLSIEALTRVVFPDAVKSGKQASPAKGPDDLEPEKGPKVATIIDAGAGAGGGSKQPTTFKPRPNETIESAMKQYAADRGISR